MLLAAYVYRVLGDTASRGPFELLANGSTRCYVGYLSSLKQRALNKDVEAIAAKQGSCNDTASSSCPIIVIDPVTCLHHRK